MLVMFMSFVHFDEILKICMEMAEIKPTKEKAELKWTPKTHEGTKVIEIWMSGRNPTHGTGFGVDEDLRIH